MLQDNNQNTTNPSSYTFNAATSSTDDDYIFVQNNLNIKTISNGLLSYLIPKWRDGTEELSSIKANFLENNAEILLTYKNKEKNDVNIQYLNSEIITTGLRSDYSLNYDFKIGYTDGAHYINGMEYLGDRLILFYEKDYEGKEIKQTLPISPYDWTNVVFPSL